MSRTPEPVNRPEEQDAADGLCRRAVLLLDANRLEEAVSLLQQALSVDPSSVDASCYLAIALRSLGRPVQSLRAAEAACTVDPDSEWAHRLRSYALLELGEREAGLEAARDAVRLAPNSWEALAALAGAQLETGRHEEAAETACRARDQEPENPEAHMLLGWVLMNGPTPGDAEAPLREALRLAPNLAGAYRNLSLVLERTGRADEGLRALEEAVRCAPQDRTHRVALRERVLRRLSPSTLAAGLATVSALGVSLLLRNVPAALPLFFLLPAGILRLSYWASVRKLTSTVGISPATLRMVGPQSRFQHEQVVLVVEALGLCVLIVLQKRLAPDGWWKYLPPVFAFQALAMMAIWARRGIRFGRVPGQEDP